ncbi:MAG: efflux RND transporter periplasmic adaptor subunit [Ginsengibacter sp.]
MKLKYWKILAGVLFLSYITSCGSKSKDPSPADTKKDKPRAGAALSVEGYLVQSSVLNSSIDVAGSLLPFEETEIHPEVSGKVVMLSIKEGGIIKRGTLLARLFDGDLQAQLHKLNVQLAIAKKTQDRQSDLLKIGGISQQDYDLSLLNVSTIEADMQVLNASINKTIIRAPFDGKIGFKNISIGAYVTPATIVTTIRQTSKLKLEFSVPEKYTSKIQIGNSISFTTESSSKKYNAKIIATESGITAENRSLKVHAIVENTDKNITAGSFATVNFDMGNNNDAILIPTQAIIPEARDKKVIVYKNGSADFNVVVTGERDSARVEILKGLAVGDTIITTGLLSIKPGSKISLSSIKKQDSK